MRWPRFCFLLAGLAGGPLFAADGRPDYSAAEKLLFMDRQLGSVKPPATLRYRFQKSGTLEPGFEDAAVIDLSAGTGGRCCATKTTFLTGTRGVKLPDLPDADGNPVILHFLEREVREMQRLTQGSQAHFRKRIRMAIFEAARVQDVRMRFKGRDIDGQEVRITPFTDDPNRPRYERLATKEYRFTLSSAVPGGVYDIRSLIPGPESGKPPLLVEVLTLEGAESSPSRNETK